MVASSSDRRSQDRGTSMTAKQRHAQEARLRATAIPRKRAVTACQNCRTKKTKCDNQRPRCTACLKGGLGCSYDSRLDHSSFDPASLLILEKISAVSHKLDALSSARLDAGHVPQDSIPDSTEDALHVEVLSPYASTDFILTWPIFAGRWPADLLLREVYRNTFASRQSGSNSFETATNSHGLRKLRISEEDVPELIDRYLSNVHPKNPIFFTGSIREYARRISEDGFGWDPISCLILLACALGAVSLKLIPEYEAGKLHGRSSYEEHADRRALGQVYFTAARKRIGLLVPSLVTSQCHMLAGIYLMYNLRQHQGWRAFHQAGSDLALYLKGRAATEDNLHGDSTESEDQHLEQRLYWTVLKSECELRTEFDLPQSELCKVHYPHAFPSPPDPANASQHDAVETPLSIIDNSNPGVSVASPRSSYQTAEEQSWFYYLSEIAMRKIENRVLNTFYKEDYHSWTRLDFEGMIAATRAIEDQLDTWRSSLPESIRFENLATAQGLDEIRLVTAGRERGIRAYLYQPYLYIAIHSAPSTDSTISSILDQYLEKALETLLGFTTGLCITHRHHGTWYGQRWMIRSGLMLFAAQKAGLISWTTTDGDIISDTRYGIALKNCVESLRYWEGESPDLETARKLFEDIGVS